MHSLISGTLSLDPDTPYSLYFNRDQTELGSIHLGPTPGRTGLMWYTSEVPDEIRRPGFNRIRLFPEGGNGSSFIGHVRFDAAGV